MQNRQNQIEDAHFERLVHCFGQVFPDLSRSAIPAATQDGVAAWDSIAQVTLMGLIGEEFNLDLDFEDFEGVVSFTSILDLVRTRIGDA